MGDKTNNKALTVTSKPVRRDRPQPRTDKYGNKVYPIYNNFGQLVYVTIPE